MWSHPAKRRGEAAEVPHHLEVVAGLLVQRGGGDQLAELLRHDRAKLRGAPPTRDAVARLLWTCGTHDRDHWSHAFLRNALRYF